MTRSLEGRRIGPYEVGGRIGAGGMGEVYKARDTRLDRAVAIKVLPSSVADDRRSRERLEREARAVATLNHPNICTLHDVGSHEGVDFLVMEHLDGETLAARIAKGPLTTDHAVQYALQIASALDRAHRSGILHRDLKPGNIMLTEIGAKLLDFGLAKTLDTEVDVTRTAEGVIVGTAAYMSPEQAQGLPLDARSDVFSFGAVLYEMASGRRAFGGDATAQVLSGVLRDNPQPLPAYSPLADIVSRCMAKQPSQRFQTMADVLRALQQAWTSPVKEAPSIAVLPFANMSADPENEYFSDGLAEEIINALTKIDGLHVAARSSSFSFKGKATEVGDVARRLKVRHVLEGSVRKSGPRVRVTAQLVDASNGYQLWSERYDRQLEDIFDVQDDIARSIVDRLKVAFGAGDSERIVKITTNSVEAYQHYLKGRAMLYRRGRWVAPALESFTKAVERRVHGAVLRRRQRSVRDDAPSARGGDARDDHRCGVRRGAQRPRHRGAPLGARFRQGRQGVSRGPRAQSEVCSGPLLVRSVLPAVVGRPPEGWTRGDVARDRRRSPVELHVDRVVVRTRDGSAFRRGRTCRPDRRGARPGIVPCTVGAWPRLSLEPAA